MFRGGVIKLAGLTLSSEVGGSGQYCFAVWFQGSHRTPSLKGTKAPTRGIPSRDVHPGLHGTGVCNYRCGTGSHTGAVARFFIDSSLFKERQRGRTAS